MRAIAGERIELSTRKTANYAGDEDAFFNFNLVEQITHGKITCEQGIFVRMCDKMGRLGNLLFGAPDTVGESVEETLKDLANYSDMVLQAWREKRFGKNQEPLLKNPTEEEKTLLQRFFTRKAA